MEPSSTRSQVQNECNQPNKLSLPTGLTIQDTNLANVEGPKYGRSVTEKSYIRFGKKEFHAPFSTFYR